jgi:Rod binding domain-containing protein
MVSGFWVGNFSHGFVGMLQVSDHYSQAMGPTETLGITPTTTATPAARTVGPAKVHQIARQFEAMFMTAMLHQAHSKSHAVGMFRAGDGERNMQPFMDQALGDAVASRRGTGIAQSIERLLNGPQPASKGK